MYTYKIKLDTINFNEESMKSNIVNIENNIIKNDAP